MFLHPSPREMYPFYLVLEGASSMARQCITHMLGMVVALVMVTATAGAAKPDGPPLQSWSQQIEDGAYPPSMNSVAW